MIEEYEEVEKKVREKLGNPIETRSQEEITVLQQLENFQKGYELRDESFAEEFVIKLMDEDVQIIGTNGVYPGDREWKSGHQSAVEMFRSDWKDWGDVKMYIDHAQIKVEGVSAWATMFGTVTRDTINDERMSFESSKQRSLQRIEELIRNKKTSSTSALYQIIQDASSILHQYGQSHLFVWPIRMSFGFIKKVDQWIMKQIHFSWPGRGFPTVRETL